MYSETLPTAYNWLMCQIGDGVEAILANATERFWSYVSEEPTSGCWLWSGGANRGGYGTLTVTIFSRHRHIQAHRFSYELNGGTIPDGYDLHHRCNIPCCVNPQHLEPLDRFSHVMLTPGNVAYIHAAKTHCINGHPLEGDHIRKRGRQRFCRICARLYASKTAKPTGRRRGPEKGSTWTWNSAKTHCIYGHEFTPANTFTYTRKNGRIHRRCLICYERNKQAMMVKAKEARRVAREKRLLEPPKPRKRSSGWRYKRKDIRTHCKYGHALTGENVSTYIDDKGRQHQRCLECVKRNNKIYNSKDYKPKDPNR